VRWEGEAVARLGRAALLTAPRLVLAPALESLPASARATLAEALAGWLARRLKPLAPLARIEAASRDGEAGPELRALLIRLAEAGGMLARADSGLDALDRRQRDSLKRLGVRIGALDLYVPALLRAGPLGLWRQVAGLDGRRALAPVAPAMAPVLPATGALPVGYRPLGKQWLRLDKADELLREAHARRTAAGGRAFALDPAPAVATGLTTASYARLLALGGFRPLGRRELGAAVAGPPAPLRWKWRPERPEKVEAAAPPPTGAFAALARLVA